MTSQPNVSFVEEVDSNCALRVIRITMFGHTIWCDIQYMAKSCKDRGMIYTEGMGFTREEAMKEFLEYLHLHMRLNYGTDLRDAAPFQIQHKVHNGWKVEDHGYVQSI